MMKKVMRKLTVLVLIPALMLASFILPAKAMDAPVISVQDYAGNPYWPEIIHSRVKEDGKKYDQDVFVIPIDQAQVIAWEPVPGAEYYEVAVRDMYTGEKVIDNTVFEPGAYFDVMGQMLNDGSFLIMGRNYKLAVGAYNYAGEASFWTTYFFRLTEPEEETNSGPAHSPALNLSPEAEPVQESNPMPEPEPELGENVPMPEPEPVPQPEPEPVVVTVPQPVIYAERETDYGVYVGEIETAQVNDGGEWKWVEVHILPRSETHALVWQPSWVENYFLVSIRDVDQNQVVYERVRHEVGLNWYDVRQALPNGGVLESGRNYKIAVGAYVDGNAFQWSEPYYFRLTEPASDPGPVPEPMPEPEPELGENVPMPEPEPVPQSQPATMSSEKLSRPEVTIEVDEGGTMRATWPEVAGAGGYGFSLYDCTEDRSIISNHPWNETYIGVQLMMGIKYRLAIAAVPQGVAVDENPELCSWTVREFTVGLRPEVTLVATSSTTISDGTYVWFDAQYTNTSKLTVSLSAPNGSPTAFQTMYFVDQRIAAREAIDYEVMNSSESDAFTGLNVYFPAGTAQGNWTIRVAADNGVGGYDDDTLTVTVTEPKTSLKYDPALPLPQGLTGMGRDKLAQVAESQIGYVEKGDNHSVYGAFTGTDGYSWCAPFVSWCAEKAGLTSSFTIKGTYANPDNLLQSGYTVWYFGTYPNYVSDSFPGYRFDDFMKNAGEKTYDSNRNTVSPSKGDLLFFATSGGSPWAHVGIIVDFDSNTKTITYVDGNGTNEGGTLLVGQSGNVAVSKWSIALSAQYICAIARPLYQDETIVSKEMPSETLQQTQIAGGFIETEIVVESQTDPIKLQGQVYSSGSKLTEVSYYIEGWNADGYYNPTHQMETYTQAFEGYSMNLSESEALVFDPSQWPFILPGTYTIHLQARTEDGTAETELDAAKVTVTHPMTYVDQCFLQPSWVEQYTLQQWSALLSDYAYEPGKVKAEMEDKGLITYRYQNQNSSVGDDTVGYIVGRKTIKTGDAAKTLYVVAVRGTTGNAEWLSNFNIGLTQDAGGFKRAAQNLMDYLDGLQIDPASSKILFTGHSRGAAVANYVAAVWSYNMGFDFDDVYAYTFACPNISKTLNVRCSGIYNYNISGDAVPYLPFAEWGYGRYGVTRTVDADTWSLQYNQFAKDLIIAEGELTSSLMKKLAQVPRDYYVSSIYPLVDDLIPRLERGEKTAIPRIILAAADGFICEEQYQETGLALLKWALTNVDGFAEHVEVLVKNVTIDAVEFGFDDPLLFCVKNAFTNKDIMHLAMDDIADVFSKIVNTHMMLTYLMAVNDDLFDIQKSGHNSTELKQQDGTGGSIYDDIGKNDGNSADHEYVIIPDEHPHLYEGKTHVVAHCLLCFPTGEKTSDTTKHVFADTNGWQRDVIGGAQEYANLSELAYATDKYADGTHGKESVLPNQFRLDSGEDFNQETDALIQTEISDDGLLIVSIAFEGSSGGDPVWGAKTKWDLF